MALFPDTPRTLVDDLATSQEFDEAKWRRFDDLYRPVMVAFLKSRFPVLSEDVDDLVQEVMIRLLESLPKGGYDATRGRFRTYLATIVSNLAVDLLRRRARYATLPLETLDWTKPEASASVVWEHLDRQWREACYAAARRQVLHHVPLPPHYAEVWRALEKGERAADVAERLGLSSAFVRQVKHRVSDLIARAVRERDV